MADFACALHAKVLRAETSHKVAHAVVQTIKRLLEQCALQRLPMLREDFSVVQRAVLGMNGLVRGADALHFAVAARSGTSHFANLDKMQGLEAQQWLQKVQCVPRLTV